MALTPTRDGTYYRDKYLFNNLMWHVATAALQAVRDEWASTPQCNTEHRTLVMLHIHQIQRDKRPHSDKYT